MFGLSMVCAVLFLVSYFAFHVGDDWNTIGGLGASNVALGVFLGGALLFIGIGIIQWARKLMGDHEIVEYRHPATSSEEDREATLAALNAGLEESGIGRRPLVRNTLLGAVGILGLPADRDAARPRPAARRQARSTRSGRRGMRVVRDVVGTPIKVSDLEIGDLVNAEPEALFPTEENGDPELEGVELQQQKVKAAVIVDRMEPDDIVSEQTAQLVGQRHRLLLQDLHPRGLPDLAERADDPPPALPLPPVDLRPDRLRQGDLRARRPRPSPAAAGSG